MSEPEFDIIMRLNRVYFADKITTQFEYTMISYSYNLTLKFYDWS